MRALAELDCLQLGAAASRATLARAHAVYASIGHQQALKEVADSMRLLESPQREVNLSG